MKRVEPTDQTQLASICIVLNRPSSRFDGKNYFLVLALPAPASLHRSTSKSQAAREWRQKYLVGRSIGTRVILSIGQAELFEHVAKQGWSIQPSVSMIRNIGFGEDATHFVMPLPLSCGEGRRDALPLRHPRSSPAESERR